MSSEDEYFIPEKIEDKALRRVADDAKKILKENDILEKILQKYIVAYNRTLSERCSSKSLQVMNQNHKPVFSTISSSGVIKSPRCSSVCAKKAADVTCIINRHSTTPLKTNRISSCKERKRLSFDVVENENMKPEKAFQEVFDEDELRIDTSTFFKHENEVKPLDSAKEGFNHNGIPECVQALSIYNPIAENPSNKTPDNNQTMVTFPLYNDIYEEETNVWYLKSRPSIFSLEIVPKVFDSPDKHTVERYNIEGKPETITSLDAYDHDTADIPTETDNNRQEMVTSPENQNSTVENCAIDDKRKEGSSISLFSPIKKEAKVSDKHKTNEPKILRPDEKHDGFSIKPIHHLKASNKPYKTPEKLQTITDIHKEERTPTNQIRVKKGTTKISTFERHSTSSIKDVETSNQNMKKRKSVDFSEEAVKTNSLVTEDQEFKLPSKLAKLNTLKMNDEKVTIPVDVSVMNCNDSICSIELSSMDTNNFFISADDSIMDCNDSFNCKDNDFIDNQNISPSNKSVSSTILNINNYVDVSVTNDKKYKRSINEASITKDCASLFSTEATNYNDCSSPMKDVKTTDRPRMKKQKSLDYSEESMIVTSLVTENKQFMVPSKISKVNDELTTNDENSMICNDSFRSTDELTMITKSPFPSAYNSAMDCNDSFNRSDGEFIVDKDIGQSDDKSIMSADHINKCKISETPNKKSERSPSEASKIKNFVPLFSPEADGKKIEDKFKSDVENSKCDKNKAGTHETKDVESLRDLMQNLSPSEKGFSDDTFAKSLTQGSVGDDATLLGKLQLRDNASKTVTPPQKPLISNAYTIKSYNLYTIQAVKFIETLKQRRSRFSMYLHLFIEDQNDLNFIFEYIEKLASILKEIAPSPLYLKAVSDFAEKGRRLLEKIHFWLSDIMRDIKCWEDCVEKVDEILKDVKLFCKEKLDKTPKDFKKWEASFRRINKKADDMILLREIKRPTIIQFGYEVENLIQLFIQCLHSVGILKQSSKVSSDKGE